MPSTVLHPPPPARDYRCSGYEPCIFAVSRLHPLKRMDLLIEAMALAKERSFRAVTAIERGWMYLQPGEERRRSGSHYTPRALTQPIVARTLEPLLAALGEHPTAAQILALRVCDPASESCEPPQ